MPPGDDPQAGAPELRVNDRRRFNADGDAREGEPEAAAAPAPEAPPARAEAPQPAAAPEAPGRVSPLDPPPASDPGHQAIYDLGIQAVFYVFYQSAMIALGASDDGGPVRVDLAEARQAINFLRVLEEKTRGNLLPEEAAALAELLADAQLQFVDAARRLQQPGGGR